MDTKKIIIISSRNGVNVDALAKMFEEQGYTPIDWKPFYSSVTSLATMKAPFIVVKCKDDVGYPTLIQLQEAKIRAVIHYIDIATYGTYGAKPTSL